MKEINIDITWSLSKVFAFLILFIALGFDCWAMGKGWSETPDTFIGIIPKAMLLVGWKQGMDAYKNKKEK